MKCDVIGFQEVFSTTTLKNLVEELGFTHLETVENAVTDVDNSSVFIKPVVAIASKHPIISVDPVKLPDSTTEELSGKKGFKFSRIPIKAKLHINEFRDVVFLCFSFKIKKFSS